MGTIRVFSSEPANGGLQCRDAEGRDVWGENKLTVTEAFERIQTALNAWNSDLAGQAEHAPLRQLEAIEARAVKAQAALDLLKDILGG